MCRDARLYVADILDAAAAVEEYLAGMTFKTFSGDRKTLDAIVRNLEVIGEAAGKLDEPSRLAMPEIEWRKITAMRNILAHEYFGVSKAIVWDTATNHLPVLTNVCRLFLKQHSDSSPKGRSDSDP